MTTEIVMGAGAMVVAGLVWLIRLEGRLNLADARYADLKEDTEEIKRDVKTLVRNGHHRGEGRA
jgi:hypothetical protein